MPREGCEQHGCLEKHFRMDCPKEKILRAQRAAGTATSSTGAKGAGKGGDRKPIDPVWAATQQCRNGETCRGRDKYCLCYAWNLNLY